MSWVEIIADRKIRDAQEEGAFDNLSGKGQPIDLDADRGIPADQRLAARLLREANYVPDWIELDRAIRRSSEALDTEIEEFATRWNGLTPAGYPCRRPSNLERDVFLCGLVPKLLKLNEEIDRFNLVVPVLSRTRGRIRVEDRLQELDARFEVEAGHTPEPGADWRTLVPSQPATIGPRNHSRVWRGRRSIG